MRNRPKSESHNPFKVSSGKLQVAAGEEVKEARMVLPD